MKVETGVPLVRAWRELRATSRHLLPPETVSDSPVLECVREGKDVNLFELPVPRRWHAHDGGRYIGTASLTITRGPGKNRGR